MKHRTPKIYIDTSVFGGVFDLEFQRASILFFDQINKGLFKPVTSIVVEEEIKQAPSNVQAKFQEILQLCEFIEISPESLELREAYLKAEILTTKSSIDALHVALTSVSDCSMIISWNFKHIVNYHKIPLYNGINLSKGYSSLSIYSPLEVIENE